jgi:hypothetical protein
MKEKDHDDDNNCPEDQIFIKGAQKFSSNYFKFQLRLTQYFFYFNVMYSYGKWGVRDGRANQKIHNLLK